MLDTIYVTVNSEGIPATAHLSHADAYDAVRAFTPPEEPTLGRIHALPLHVGFKTLGEIGKEAREADPIAGLLRELAEEEGRGDEDG